MGAWFGAGALFLFGASDEVGLFWPFACGDTGDKMILRRYCRYSSSLSCQPCALAKTAAVLFCVGLVVAVEDGTSLSFAGKVSELREEQLRSYQRR